MHTLRVSIYLCVDVSLSVFLKAVVGPNTEQADASTHVFCMWYEIKINPSGFRCLSEH